MLLAILMDIFSILAILHLSYEISKRTANKNSFKASFIQICFYSAEKQM
jgi:hypothetical protein